MAPENKFLNPEYYYPQQKRRQEDLYLRDGLTPEAVRLEIERMKKHEAESNVPHEWALYVNSSDSLPNFGAIDAKGKKVLTIAGSGEFSQSLISNGAREVDIFDISLPACFFAELKLVAASELTYKEYEEMFGTIEDFPLSPDESAKHMVKIFNPDLYKGIKHKLSIQAQTYFDTIIQNGNERFFNLNMRAYESSRGTDFEKHWFGFIRYRSARDEYIPIAQRVPFLRDSREYERLQGNLRKSTWITRRKDITGADMDYRIYDLIYLSNVGYHRVIDVAKDLVDKNAKRVIFTFQPGRYPFNWSDSYLDNQGEVFKDSDNNLPPEKLDLIYSGHRLAQFKWDSWKKNKPELLKPGTEIEVNKGLRLKILGFDPRAEFPYTAELSKA